MAVDPNTFAALTFGPPTHRGMPAGYVRGVAVDFEELEAERRRITRYCAARERTIRAKDVTRAYFRRLNREGVAIDLSRSIPSAKVRSLHRISCRELVR